MPRGGMSSRIAHRDRFARMCPWCGLSARRGRRAWSREKWPSGTGNSRVMLLDEDYVWLDHPQARLPCDGFRSERRSPITMKLSLHRLITTGIVSHNEARAMTKSRTTVRRKPIASTYGSAPTSRRQAALDAHPFDAISMGDAARHTPPGGNGSSRSTDATRGGSSGGVTPAMLKILATTTLLPPTIETRG